MARLGQLCSPHSSNGVRPRPTVVLVDNGSVKAASTLGLREVARSLEERLGGAARVIAASAKFSDRVDPAELGGEKAWTLLTLLRHLRKARQAESVVLLPVFFGPSELATRFMPQQVATVRAETDPKLPPSPPMAIAPTLICNCPFLFPGAPEDDRIARILLDRVHEAVQKHSLGPTPLVAVVDHGSPNPVVTRCRSQVVQQLQRLLASGEGRQEGERLRPRAVLGCCMERRPEPQYDFNDPLLAKLLVNPELVRGGEDVIVALMFLQSGKHAGPNGDIAQIIGKAQEERPHDTPRIVMTEVVGAHPLLIEVLEERSRQAVRLPGW